MLQLSWLEELKLNQSNKEIQKHFGEETNFDGKVFEIKKEQLEKGNLKEIQKMLGDLSNILMEYLLL